LAGTLLGGKGKKQQYAAQQTPQQQSAYNSLLQLLQRQSGTGSAGYQPTSDAMNILYQTFLGKNYTPAQNQLGGQSGGYNMPQNFGGGNPLMSSILRRPQAR
jgi:hypothetical protein